MEENEFALLRRRQPSNLELKIETYARPAVVLLAGAGTAYAGLQEGWVATGFGGAIGLFAGIGIWDAASGYISKIRQRRFERREIKADKNAVREGAETIYFDYMEKVIACVLRPEYEEKGHDFLIYSGDRIIQAPVFSYRPGMSPSLAFGFCVPGFYMDLDEDLAIEQIRNEVQHKGDNWLRFENDVIKDLEMGWTSVRFLLSYRGKNPKRFADRFSAAASEAMNTASRLWTYYNVEG